LASGHDSAEYVLIDRTNVDETKRRQPGKTKDVLSVKRDITGRKSRRPVLSIVVHTTRLLAPASPAWVSRSLTDIVDHTLWLEVE